MGRRYRRGKRKECKFESEGCKRKIVKRLISEKIKEIKKEKEGK